MKFKNPFRLTREERAQIDALIEERAISWNEVWGNGKQPGGGGPISMEAAVSLAPVYAATSLIADLICTFPLKSYNTIKGVTAEMDHPNKLIASPSAFNGPIAWTHRAVISMALRGNAYGLITGTDAFGYPTAIEWLHPDEVSLRSDRTTAPPQWFWLGKPIDNSKFVHIPYYTVPGRILGLSPIRNFALQIESGLLAQRFGRDFFRNSATPSGILTTEQKVLNDGDAKTAADRFRRQANGRGIAVLNNGLKYQAISIAPEESQFLQTLKMTATQIAAIYKVPPEMVGGETAGSMTYTNVDGWPITVSRFALQPYIVRIEECLEQYMPGGQTALYDMDAFQRPDFAARTTGYDLALKDQWMEVDEVRQKENLKPFGGKKGGLLALPSATPAEPGLNKPSPADPSNAPENDSPVTNTDDGDGPPPADKNTGAGKGNVQGNSLPEKDEKRTALQRLTDLHERMIGWDNYGD